MNSSLRIFLVIEALLGILALWQIVHNPGLLILIILGSLSAIYAMRRKHRSTFNNFQLIVGAIMIFVGLMNSPAMWIMVICAVLFIGLKGVEITGVDFLQNTPWNKKQMIMVETTTSEPKNGRRFKRPWFGNQRIGSNVYEWDDINIDIFTGDTIIDLGNTLLPKDDSIIVIRKGLGRTRVLVPLGVAVVLEHSTFFGNVVFEEERFSLKNESIKLYSKDYDTNQRRLKILTNSLIGDVEVIRV